MKHIQSILSTHPNWLQADDDDRSLLHLIAECAHTCQACADACLGEKHVEELTTCIRIDTMCAKVCEATTQALLTRGNIGGDLLQRQLETCAAFCRACAEECERHAEMHEHCRICAETCRQCAEECANAAE